MDTSNKKIDPRYENAAEHCEQVPDDDDDAARARLDEVANAQAAAQATIRGQRRTMTPEEHEAATMLAYELHKLCDAFSAKEVIEALADACQAAEDHQPSTHLHVAQAQLRSAAVNITSAEALGHIGLSAALAVLGDA